ncbi:MAG: integrase family protein [Deltaproteobacteria bacterium]|nr:integrase family protein [Deltaproteobacteria bacterium]
MPRLKITKANMAGIIKPVSKQVDYYDTELAGFGVRATKDVLTFFVRSTLRGTTQKPFIPIGTYGTFTPDQARIKAKEYLRRLDNGENPHPKAQPKHETITIQDLYRQYISGKKTPLGDSTVYAYNSWMNNHFSDWLQLPANSITGSMVLDRMALMEKNNGMTQAACSIKLLRGLYRIGIALHPGVITHNPVEAVREVRGREWAPRKRRMTYIEPADLPAWFKAVNDYHLPKGKDYLLLLLYTGLRKMEMATLKWSDIDFKTKAFTFTPEKKRGEKPEDDRVTMPLSVQAYRLLLQRKAQGWENDYVFPGKHPSPHLSNADNYKRDIIKTSGVKFCLHDLRRTFITIAESLDIPHYALKALLNHSMGNDVTGGYIIMSSERLREPMQRIADKIMGLATAKPPVEDQAQRAA